MPSLRDQTAHSVKLLELLEQRPCSFCDDGHLVRDEYKGNAAVVCSSCGTPGAQIWSQ